MEQALNDFFLVVMGSSVLLMQLGFALLEAGSVRSKNTVNILIKNFLDAMIGALIYYAVGWGFANGEPSDSGFIGENQFFLIDTPIESYTSWFFQYVFAATAATIVSGAVAERCQFTAYFMYSALITGFVYPVVACWGWNGEGWAAKWGYGDFAGSGIVHCCGGAAALAGAYFLGPREGRFAQDGTVQPLQGHSLVLAAQGGLILFWGFLAFNGGSVLALSMDSTAAFSLAVVNTVLAGAASTCTMLLFNLQTLGVVQLGNIINGSLAGLVSICAGADRVEPWAAIIIGIISVFFYTFTSHAMLKYKIDDPLDAVAVHLGCGFWGVISVGFFANTTTPGLFYDSSGETLGINLVVVLIIIAWTLAISGTAFYLLSKAGMLRVDPVTEQRGLDMKHKERAYTYTPLDVELRANHYMDELPNIKSYSHVDTGDADGLAVPQLKSES